MRKNTCRVVCSGRDRNVKMEICSDSRGKIKTAKKVGMC